jgi:serine/threonine protein kinase
MAEMLRQVLPGLAHLHMIGYSHGDLKLENICARTSINNNFKFTLIDFGMSQKLPQ